MYTPLESATAAAAGYKREYLPLPSPSAATAPGYNRDYSPLKSASAGGPPVFKEELEDRPLKRLDYPAARQTAVGGGGGGVKREYAEEASGADYYSSGSGSSPQPPPAKVGNLSQSWSTVSVLWQCELEDCDIDSKFIY